MKMNNKGFTVVELLATFTLTMIITTLLFAVVLELKDIYVSSELETSIKNENALVAREISQQIDGGNLPVDCDGSLCTLKDGQQITVLSNREVKVGNKVFEMPNDTYINDDHIITSTCTNDASLPLGTENCYVKIAYTVTSEDFSDDILFNLVLSYYG